MVPQFKSKEKLAILEKIKAHQSKLPDRKLRVGDLVKVTQWSVISDKTNKLCKPYVFCISTYLVTDTIKWQAKLIESTKQMHGGTLLRDEPHDICALQPSNGQSWSKDGRYKNQPYQIHISCDYEIVSDGPL